MHLQPELQKPKTEPKVAAKPAALDSPVRRALPAVPEEGYELAVAVVKQESLRASPAWKVRPTREAAQHTGNTLFADICQPGTFPVSTCIDSRLTSAYKTKPLTLQLCPIRDIYPAKAGRCRRGHVPEYNAEC